MTCGQRGPFGTQAFWVARANLAAGCLRCARVSQHPTVVAWLQSKPGYPFSIERQKDAVKKEDIKRPTALMSNYLVENVIT